VPLTRGAVEALGFFVALDAFKLLMGLILLGAFAFFGSFEVLPFFLAILLILLYSLLVDQSCRRSAGSSP